MALRRTPNQRYYQGSTELTQDQYEAQVRQLLVNSIYPTQYADCFLLTFPAKLFPKHWQERTVPVDWRLKYVVQGLWGHNFAANGWDAGNFRKYEGFVFITATRADQRRFLKLCGSVVARYPHREVMPRDPKLFRKWRQAQLKSMRAYGRAQKKPVVLEESPANHGFFLQFPLRAIRLLQVCLGYSRDLPSQWDAMPGVVGDEEVDYTLPQYGLSWRKPRRKSQRKRAK